MYIVYVFGAFNTQQVKYQVIKYHYFRVVSMAQPTDVWG